MPVTKFQHRLTQLATSKPSLKPANDFYHACSRIGSRHLKKMQDRDLQLD